MWGKQVAVAVESRLSNGGGNIAGLLEVSIPSMELGGSKILERCTPRWLPRG